MYQDKQSDGNDVGRLTEDARALVAATADVAGAKVEEARKRLQTALESAKKIAGNVCDKVAVGAKATDKVVRENPYQALAIGVGVGALIGFFLARRGSSKGD